MNDLKGYARKIVSHRDLEVYQIAFKVAMAIFELSKKFPPEEKFALTDQIRRSARFAFVNYQAIENRGAGLDGLFQDLSNSPFCAFCVW